MRCDDCQSEALARPRYCECCGRAWPADADAAATDADAASVASLIEALPPMEPLGVEETRCESCGGPIDGGGTVCAECERVFSPVFQKQTLEPPHAVAEAALSAAPAAPPAIATSSPAESEAPTDRPEPVRPTPEAKPFARGKAVPALPRPGPPRVSSTGLAWAAAFVIAAGAGIIAVALGIAWLDRQWNASTPPLPPPVQSGVPVSSADSTTPPHDVESSSAAADGDALAGHKNAGARAANGARRRTPARPRKSPTSARPAAASARNADTVGTAEPDPIPLQASVPSGSRVAPFMRATPEPLGVPRGPVFDASDVSDPPRIVSRIEPRVPGHLRAGASQDVVIARVLVSQVGRASSVRLLRRSKAGPELDALVVDAVKQWRFEPARRRGQAVSCWYNVGVPLRGK